VNEMNGFSRAIAFSLLMGCISVNAQAQRNAESSGVQLKSASELEFTPDVVARPDPAFKGKVTLSAKDSVPNWPQPAQAPAGAPSVVVILLDDIGFADTSTFGGIAQTPELTRLAAAGLRYNNFNTTATCSPTRAALLSGRNHHRVGFGVAEAVAGFPGYNFVWKKSTVSIPEVLRRSGYSTAAFGKWHNTPPWEMSPLGPFDHWPTGSGFEYFYGFMGGREDEWEPSSLYRNTIPVEPPATPQQGYHLTTDLTNEAIRWLHTHESLAPGKPYFLYFATGAVHSPHQAPREWIDPYRGKFDRGWDSLREEVFQRQKQLDVIPVDAELTPRPQSVPAWDSLSADQKKLFARQMEVYAGFISHTDHEVGRLLKAVQQGPGGDNTLVLYIVGDNGASPEGGIDGSMDALTSVEDQLKHLEDLGGPLIPSNEYSDGWAWLGATPFKGWKWVASYFGGVRNPMIVSWPTRIKRGGGLRRQFTHVNDVAATIYDVTGIHLPSVVDGVKQQPLDGVSFAYTFDHPDSPSRHRIQYFEMVGNRAIYDDGWVAAATHFDPASKTTPDLNFASDRWQLYHVDTDFSEAHDLATEYPGKLRGLRQLFDHEARKNEVYPLLAILASTKGEASVTDEKREFVYYPETPRLPRTAMPPLSGTSYLITAQAVIPDIGAQGVILSYGGRESGFAFYVKNDRLYYESNPLNGTHEIIASDIEVPHGKVTLAFEFTKEKDIKTGPWGKMVSAGIGRLFINGKVAGLSKMTDASQSAYFASLGVGEAFGSPVSNAFQPPFAFTGALERVKVELK
jgi:arylsulfatase A-like enzyme